MANDSITKVPAKTFFWLALFAAGAALGVHGYLAHQHYDLVFGAATSQSICDLSGTFNCTAVSASRYSEFLSVPLGVWGFAANSVLLVLLLWSRLTEDENLPPIRRNIWVVAIFIATTSVVMGTISLLFLGQFCLFCIGAYVLSFLGLFAVVKAFPHAVPTFKALTASPLSMIVLVAIAFLATMIANDQIKSSYGAREIGSVIRDSIQEWQSTPARNIETVDPLVEGAAKDKARMTIVEFADFRCIHCKHAAPMLKAFVASHADVRLEFQTWPLDGECNSKIPQANGASCLLARTVWCAEKKFAKGWSAHGFIFANDILANSLAVEEALPKIADKAGIHAEELKACANSDEAKETVRRQADLGNLLNVQGTPTIYVNGRHLPSGQILAVLKEAYLESIK